MRTHFILFITLPLLAFSCSDDSDGRAVGGTSGGGAAAIGGSGGGSGSGGSAGSAVGSAESSAGGSAGGTASAGAAGAAGSGSEDGPDAGGGAGGGDEADDGTMTFFVTSDGIGDGGNLGGLDGADDFCTELAVAVEADFGRRTWHAYLSTADVDARDRIGTGPWRNQAGNIIANDLGQLHDQGEGMGEDGALDQTWPVGDLTVALDEQGNQVPNNVHDILTGTLVDGTADVANTCADWTSSVSDAAIQAGVGHSNRTGGNRPESFSTAHAVGCSQDGAENITQGGGRGSLYCFAVITGD